MTMHSQRKHNREPNYRADTPKTPANCHIVEFSTHRDTTGSLSITVHARTKYSWQMTCEMTCEMGRLHYPRLRTRAHV